MVSLKFGSGYFRSSILHFLQGYYLNVRLKSIINWICVSFPQNSTTSSGSHYVMFLKYTNDNLKIPIDRSWNLKYRHLSLERTSYGSSLSFLSLKSKIQSKSLAMCDCCVNTMKCRVHSTNCYIVDNRRDHLCAVYSRLILPHIGKDKGTIVNGAACLDAFRSLQISNLIGDVSSLCPIAADIAEIVIHLQPMSRMEKTVKHICQIFRPFKCKKMFFLCVNE